MRSIKDIIEGLSDEEKELHKDLIEDSLKREISFDKMGSSVKSLKESFTNLFEKIEHFNNDIEKANKIIEDTNNKIALARIPKENCFNA